MLKGGDFIRYINSCKDYIFFIYFVYFFEEEEFVRIIFRIEKVVYSKVFVLL